MVFTRLLRRLSAQQRTSTSRKRPRTFRPQFEQLEPRQMLSATALISGAAIAEAGKAYQLDLSASAPVASWGIDWNNDSVIDETVAGTASSVSHVFTTTGSVNISALADGSPASVSLLGKSLGALSLSTVPQNPSESIVVGGFLYVADLQGDSVLKYDLANPSAAPTTIVNSSNGLEGAYGLAVRHNATTGHDELFVSGWNVQGAPATAKILTVDLTTLGVSVFADNADGLNGPTGMAFDTSGNLYVANWWTNQVLRFDASGNPSPSTGNTGAVFVAAGNGLNTPAGVAFDASGNLLVTSRNSGQVLQYSSGGSYLGVFGDAGTTNLLNPQGITIGPDGDVYVADITLGRVKYFDGSSGKFLGSFDAGPNKGPVNVAFDPTGVDAHAYVSSRGDTYGGVDGIQQFEGPFSTSAAQVLPVQVQQATFGVNTTTSGQQGETQPVSRTVGTDSQGNSVIVWRDAPSDTIRVRRFDASGNALSVEIVVNSNVTSVSGPTIAVAPDGHFVVVYSGDGVADHNGAYAQRFNADGTKNGAAFLVNKKSNTAEGDAAVAMAPNPSVAGYDFIVTWTGVSGQQNAAYAQRFSASGTAVGNVITIPRVTKTLDSSVAIDASGNFTLGWAEGTADFGHQQRLQRYNKNGSPVGSTITLPSVGEGIMMAYDAAGNLGVVYQRNLQNQPNGIALHVFDTNGNDLLTGPETLLAGAAEHARRPSISVDSTGHFVVAWEANDDYGKGVYARRISNISGGTATLENTFLVSLYTSHDQVAASIAQTASGFMVVWNGAGEGDDEGVFAKLFTV